MKITNDALAHLARLVGIEPECSSQEYYYCHTEDPYFICVECGYNNGHVSDDWPEEPHPNSRFKHFHPDKNISHADMLLEAWSARGRDWEIVCVKGEYIVTLFDGGKIGTCDFWTAHGKDRAETTCRAFLAATGWEGEGT